MWQAIWDFLRGYWDLTLLVVTWGGLFLLGFRKRRDWKRKRFLGQVTFSLNLIRDETLLLRTLLQLSARDIWQNDYGVKLVQNAAAQTTAERPFLRLRSQRDMDFVKRAVLNELSERFAQVYLAEVVSAQVKTAIFIFGVTWERYGDIRTHKLRVIIMERMQLEAMFAPNAPEWKVVSDVHRDRITTLRHMHELMKSDDSKQRALLDEVELGVAVGS